MAGHPIFLAKLGWSERELEFKAGQLAFGLIRVLEVVIDRRFPFVSVALETLQVLDHHGCAGFVGNHLLLSLFMRLEQARCKWQCFVQVLIELFEWTDLLLLGQICSFSRGFIRGGWARIFSWRSCDNFYVGDARIWLEGVVLARFKTCHVAVAPGHLGGLEVVLQVNFCLGACLVGRDF